MAEETGGALADVLGVDPTIKPVRPAPAPGVVQPRVVQEDTGSARDLVLGKLPPTVTPPKDPDKPFTSRGYSSLYDIPGELFQSIKRDLTPAFHLPDLRPGHWTDVTPAPYGPPPPATNLSPGAAGVKQGVRDVGNTIVGGLAPLVAPVVNAFIPGAGKTVTDAAGRVEEQRQADNAEFQRLHGDSNWASAGRIGGQFLATAPLLGPLGKAAQLGASYIPGAVGNVARFITGATPAGSVVPRGVQLATEGAITGGEFGALTSGKSDESVGDQVTEGAVGGAIAGPVLGATLGTVRKLTGVAGGADVLKAKLAQQARDELGLNVPLTQRTKTALSGTQMADTDLRRDAARVLVREMGEDADNIAPEVLGAARDRLDAGFKNFANQAGKVSAYEGPRNALAMDLANIGQRARDIPLPKDGMDILNRQMQLVLNDFYGSGGGRGTITPEGWMALTGKDGKLARAYEAAPSYAKPYIAGIQDALMDRLEASAGQAAKEEIKKLRYQWRVMRTAEGAQLPTGDVSFAKLGSQIERAAKKYDPMSKQYAYDSDSKLNLLARVGREFLGTQADSTTAARLTGSSITKMAMDAATRAATYVPQALMRSPWATQNAINTTLGRPVQDLFAAGIPGIEPLLGPSVAMSVGEREMARRRQQRLLGQ
jgi:hypothetical protein